ncbi:shikimate dehydrogenase [Salinibacterium sp. G-O1]|uniref:shikimate dehydrogenase n=1 Tax=Salinibacterium sp. G-O1 TaxID=3046208 RepID=UPI0024B9CF79|nr:shikimate dehydrogenase [Salinibacterium sp. G-O1]MDJ0335202.1 shikimate dehydrogenase [Salinibacterium sp. G-O1]
MSNPDRSRLAVLGSPISHSLSPAIHRAAYDALGLDWTYESADVTGETLAAFVAARDSTWRGLSLTMPLKRDILGLLDSRDDLVDVVGAANTVLFGEAGELRGFNTDVYGVERSFRDAGIERLRLVHILGAGATAASVITGAQRLGARQVQVSARTPAKAGALVELGHSIGVEVSITPWGETLSGHPDAVVSTVPGGESVPAFSHEIRSASALFDVAYDPWPSNLATSWAEAGGTVISGLDLLVNQAVGQIRIFVGGDQTVALVNEPAVVAAMRAALDRR